MFLYFYHLIIVVQIATATKAPLFLFPGFLGSGLFTKINSTFSTRHPSCSPGRGTFPENRWFRSWVSVNQFVFDGDCWQKAFGLSIETEQQNIFGMSGDREVIDFDSGIVEPTGLLQNPNLNIRYVEPAGVETVVDNFGGLHGITYLDYFIDRGSGDKQIAVNQYLTNDSNSNQNILNSNSSDDPFEILESSLFPDDIGVPGSQYFSDLISSLEASGWEPNKSLFGVPFDWRLPPNQLPWERIQRLIEMAVSSTGKKAVLLGHSLVATPAWKETNINRFISISGPYGGSTTAVWAVLTALRFRGLTSSNQLEYGVDSIYPIIKLLPQIYQKGLQNIYSSFGSVYTLMPNEQILGTVPIITTPNATFTSSSWPSLLPPIRRQQTEWSFRTFQNLVAQDPGVPTACIWGLDNYRNATVTGLEFDEAIGNTPDRFPDPFLIYGSGDNIVSEQSLSSCAQLSKNLIDTRVFPNANHLRILFDPVVVKYLIDLVQIDIPQQSFRSLLLQKIFQFDFFWIIGGLILTGILSLWIWRRYRLICDQQMLSQCDQIDLSQLERRQDLRCQLLDNTVGTYLV